jgi:hypothetical protein
MNKSFEKLRELLEKSYQGEWQIGFMDGSGSGEDKEGNYITANDYVIASARESMGYKTGIYKKQDAEFIVESHNQLPKLLEALDLAIEGLKFYAKGNGVAGEDSEIESNLEGDDCYERYGLKARKTLQKIEELGKNEV